MCKINRLLAALIFLFGQVAPAWPDTTIIPAIPDTLTNGTVADANAVMANFTAIQSYVNANAAANGINTSITTLSGLTSPPAGAGSLMFMGTSTAGTANAPTVPTAYPGSFALISGTCIWWQPALTNTSTVTLNVNGKGAVAVVKPSVAGLVVLAGGEIVGEAPIPSPALTCYNGTYWVLMNPQASVEAPLPYAAVASAATVAISNSACPNFKCEITGTTTITSLGSSATTGQVFYLTFGGVLTLTYNATSLKLPGSANITTAANDVAQATYLGSGNWQVLRYTAAIQPANLIDGVSPSAVGLVVTNDGTTPNSKIDVTAQSAVMTNSTYNASVTGVNVSVVINLSASAGSTGNDLDTGSFAASTWYYVYLISNGTTVAGLASASSTSPTLPLCSGNPCSPPWQYYMRVGAMSSNGSTQLYRTLQNGPQAQYKVVASSTTPSLPVLLNGATGSISTPTWTGIQVTGNGYVAPPTAQQIRVNVLCVATGAAQAVILAPNNAYGAFESANPPMLQNGSTGNLWYGTVRGDIVLESNSLYAASNCGTQNLISAEGWRDAVAAN
jgi:hypothetical protein